MKGRLKRPPSLTERAITGFRNYFGYEEQPVWIRMSQREETEGIMMLGDPGTGKSQTIHHFLLQIAARRPAEAVVVYDPACEFVKRHYNPRRGDIILNPLDKRSPHWSPSLEVRVVTDKKLVTESFLPEKRTSARPRLRDSSLRRPGRYSVGSWNSSPRRSNSSPGSGAPTPSIRS